MSETTGQISGWERVAQAVEQVRHRLKRSTAALEAAGIPYAIVGGNAVAEWVGRVDPAAVRTTQDVDILIRRSDFEAVKRTLESTGFIHRHAESIGMFLDSVGGKARDAVHIVYAGEKVRPEYVAPTPDITESEPGADFRTLSLEALVHMKLTSFRRKDQVHLQDMLDIGILNDTWLTQLPPELAARLQQLLDDPNG